MRQGVGAARDVGYEQTSGLVGDGDLRAGLQHGVLRGDAAAPEHADLGVPDLDRVADNYRRMAALIPWGEIFYAVKANPAAPIIERLAAAGASFDAASPAEIAACIAKGVSSTLISYGNTVKKASDIAFATTVGVDLFAFDSAGELDKIAAHAPGAGVICRIVVSNDGARWPLTRKFGCDPAAALGLLRRAADSGLRPLGLSFHAGSQQTNPARWEEAIALCADIGAQADAEGMPLDVLNLGGGFGIPYAACDEELDLAPIGDELSAMTDRAAPAVIVLELGRYLVAQAGWYLTSVLGHQDHQGRHAVVVDGGTHQRADLCGLCLRSKANPPQVRSQPRYHPC